MAALEPIHDDIENDRLESVTTAADNDSPPPQLEN